jgi:hypothetical protein
MHQQLTLFNPIEDHTQRDTENIQNSPLRKIVHWVGANPTARGTYYHYYWQDRTVMGKPVTKNRYIRGSRVGTALGESRKSQVESLIESGKSPSEICRFLEGLPRSPRRFRYPDWLTASGRDEDLQMRESF